MFVDAALWKVEEFCNSIGIDFHRPIPEDNDGTPVVEYINKSGKGYFEPEGEKGYLGVAELHPAHANNGPDGKVVLPPAAQDDEQLPF